jgi:hypothetical protein
LSEADLAAGGHLRCPDEGVCGHGCPAATYRQCWRAHNAGPLSGVFPGDQWPMVGPLPAGSLVTGTIKRVGLVIRPQCKGHIWSLGPAIESNWSTGSGWVQPATCLICEYTTAPMDCEWWQEPADLSDIAHAAQLVTIERGRLGKVYENLVARMSGGQVQTYAGMANFDE